jgi:hypothetical protein
VRFEGDFDCNEASPGGTEQPIARHVSAGEDYVYEASPEGTAQNSSLERRISQKTGFFRSLFSLAVIGDHRPLKNAAKHRASRYPSCPTIRSLPHIGVANQSRNCFSVCLSPGALSADSGVGRKVRKCASLLEIAALMLSIRARLNSGWKPPHLCGGRSASALRKVFLLRSCASATALHGSAGLSFCHPDRSVPGFPTSQCEQRPRMRLSLQRAARNISTPRFSTGNPGERSGGTCGSFRPVLTHPCKAPASVTARILDPSTMSIGNGSFADRPRTSRPYNSRM